MEGLPIEMIGIKFASLSKYYLELFDSLRERNLDAKEAASVAKDVLVAYLTFSNNDKFADSAGVGIEFVPEDE